MKIKENSKITSELFCKDIRMKDLGEDFERIFGVKMTDLLSEYEYDEIDEFPIEIKNKGIMIGFMAETIKVPPQIEYIDLDIYNYPQNINYLANTISITIDSFKSKNIEEYLTSCTNLRIYYSLYNIKQIDRIVFLNENLRYELLINEYFAISRIRICFNDNESTVDMRTFYPFDNE